LECIVIDFVSVELIQREIRGLGQN